MTSTITPTEFHAADGVDGWRVILGWACTHFRTPNFAAGVALIDAIGQLADAADHHPDVDLRYKGVTVRVTTHSAGGLTAKDIALAGQISAAARELGLAVDPSAVQLLEVAIDAMVISDVLPFWRALLGYVDDGEDELADPRGIGPRFWFQQMDSSRPDRNRIHLDVNVPHDQAEARIAAALAAGGRLVEDRFAPKWWVLADVEGNEACVSTWLGRD